MFPKIIFGWHIGGFEYVESIKFDNTDSIFIAKYVKTLPVAVC